MITIDENSVIVISRNGEVISTGHTFVSVDDTFFNIFLGDLEEKPDDIHFTIEDATPYKEQVESLRQRANHFEAAYNKIYAELQELKKSAQD